MSYSNCTRVIASLIVALLLAVLDLSATASSSSTVNQPKALVADQPAASAVDVDAQRRGSVANRLENSTYYTLRRDMRRCASPRCGGYFVKRVNHPRTRCADGRNMAECYVAEIDWNGQPSVEPGDALLRGEMFEKRYSRVGRFGVFRVSESWRAATNRRADGLFYRVRDLGVRCITHPCLTHRESKLNTAVERNVAGVQLPGQGGSDESMLRVLTSPEGMLVAGNHRRVTGPGGRADTLDATQFYLRADAPVATNPCKKTGCSGQVCADRDVVTTCEWRSEYECYRTARCERQQNGECGFTQTRELTACLRRR